VVFVDATAYAGAYNKNPYNFQNFSLDYLEFAVNNQSVPSVPFKPDFSINRYTNEFLSMFAHQYPSHGGNFISLEDYASGYAIYMSLVLIVRQTKRSCAKRLRDKQC
jgi:hypothetical protein